MEEEKVALLGESESEKEELEVREVEIHLFWQGKGPIVVFKSKLGGWEHDQLDVRQILHNHSLKSIFAFNPQSGRGAPIRFTPKNGRSVLSYRNGAVLYIDGEPKESLLKPLGRILVGFALIATMIMLVSSDTTTTTTTTEWIQKFNVYGVNLPPLILACVIIVLMRKRTKDFIKKLGL